MRLSDTLHFATGAILAQPLRVSLILLAMSIGVASVTILTTLGESARLYIVHEFESLGTHLMIVLPGRTETTGGQPPLFGETARDLTLDDAKAIGRNRHIAAIAPVMIGSAPVSAFGLERETNIIGSTAALRQVRHLQMAKGRFLPAMDAEKSLPVCVIGHTIERELFSGRKALGQWLRINDRRFRIVGVLASEGRSIGVDFDEMLIIPVASAQSLFNRQALFRILAESKSKSAMYAASREIRQIIKARHEGEEDITVITQDSVVSAFDKILTALTLTVAGIAAISLAVAGILVMNVMLISVSQRTSEIGLLKALGASKPHILGLFISEAAILSGSGAFLGFLLGQIAVFALQILYPDFILVVPDWALFAALTVAIGTGLLFGALPAFKAAGLDPIRTLSRR